MPACSSNHPSEASPSATPPKDPIFHAVEPGADQGPPGEPTLRTCRKHAGGSRLVSQSLLVLKVRALTGGQVTIEFFHVFEDRHARQRLHDLEDFLDLRLHVDE